MREAGRVASPWLLIAALAACCAQRQRPQDPLPPVRAESAEALQAALARLEPERFRMVHQVAASYGGQAFLMTGYLLGRRDGAFRISASAAVGPRLFDAAKTEAGLATKVHFAPLAERLDVRHIAQAIDRVYFVECPSPGEAQGDVFIARCDVRGAGDDVDEVEVTTSARYLTPIRKRFFLAGAPRLEVTYRDLEHFGELWEARKIDLVAVEGYRLEIGLASYVPGFAFDDALLTLE